MIAPLEFEKSVYELETRLAEITNLPQTGNPNNSTEIIQLRQKIDKQLESIYSKLSPWQKVQVARHPERPSFKEYVASLIEDFVELSGYRSFAEDQAIIAGLGRFRGQSVMIMWNQKGNDTESRIRHNFGMARPEGYRKAKRLMQMADK